MKRLAIAALFAAMIATSLGAPSAQAQSKCRFQRLDGRSGWTAYETKRTIRCVARDFAVSVDTAFHIADRESNFYARAVNPTSGACGVYQHIRTYFPARLGAVPSRYRPWQRDCLNARSNTLAALWMARVAGWGAWSL